MSHLEGMPEGVTQVVTAMNVYVLDARGRYAVRTFERIETRPDGFVFREITTTPPRDTFEEAQKDLADGIAARHTRRMEKRT